MPKRRWPPGVQAEFSAVEFRCLNRFPEDNEPHDEYYLEFAIGYKTTLDLYVFNSFITGNYSIIFLICWKSSSDPTADQKILEPIDCNDSQTEQTSSQRRI